LKIVTGATMSVLDRLAVGDVPLIDTVELVRVRLALREPFVASHGVEHDRDLILVRVIGADGSQGWGECPTLSRPGYTSEHTDAAWQVLRDELVPAWMRGEARGLPHHPMARSALVAAVADAGLRRDGISLTGALGGRFEPLVTTAVVGMSPSIDDLIDRCAARVREGHRHLKLKIAPGWDVDPLRAVASVFPSVTLAADANGSYRTIDAVPPALGALGITYLEQPLPPGDLTGSASLRRATGITVALDESVDSVGSLQAAARLGALDVVNVKAARLGGLVEARRVLDAAADLGLDAFVGGMLESAVGRGAGLAMATHRACVRPTDLGPSTRYFVEDVADPIGLHPGGCLLPPDGAGIGVVPRADALERLAVARHEVSR
jgi:o-succinylbenzoate synthase